MEIHESSISNLQSTTRFMLSELYIRNFAIIDEVRLTLANGFNVLTGETGAGKSIILDAVMLILGGRADRSMIRAGCKLAQIEAIFQMEPRLQGVLRPILEAEGLDGESEHELIVAREVRATGRTICRVNGRAISVKLLQEIGEHLVDIHGQGSHLSLLKPRSHLPVLDAYGNLIKERKKLGREVSALRKLQRELVELQQDERAIAQRIDLLNYQVEEIDAATLQAGEEPELVAERKRLANAEKLMRFSAETLAILLGTDDETPSVNDMLNQAERAITQLARLDDTQNSLLEQLQGVIFQFNEVAADVDDYQATLEFNPERLTEVEERIELINQLKRKYGDTIDDVLAFRDNAAAQLTKFERSGERIGELEKEIDGYLRKIGRIAATLSKKRQKAAQKLAKTVEIELGNLRMNARFQVEFERRPDPAGVYVGDERFAFDHTGIDRSEFLISTNPGEPLKPMAKVASGGETARLMLALKTALAQVDETPTLIFDEIDQGIGGRIGDTVGQKLWGLTAIGQHQVLVVTHLPQLAGYGDRHFHVSKHVTGGRTRTRVATLDFDHRVHELAAMLGTDNDHARGGARSILHNADDVKMKYGQVH